MLLDILTLIIALLLDANLTSLRTFLKAHDETIVLFSFN